MGIHNLVSLLGIFCLLLIAWLFSSSRRTINWRVIGWGVGLQLLFGFFVFFLPAGTKFFLMINDLVIKMLESATAGTNFLFGRLALPPGATSPTGETSLGFFLAFQALPTIIFFASLVAVLYYLGIMTWLIRIFAFAFTKLMRVSGAEALCASSNIFVGIEAALTIRPYLVRMTRSELCTILTTGMATVSSSVLAVYILTLKSEFPTIAGHLVSASILSAPAALVVSKIICPETEVPETMGESIRPYYEKEGNVFEAVINGANAGVKLTVGIVALLLAMLGLVALLDQILGGAGGAVNNLLGWHVDWTLKGLLGYLFYPVTIIMGVPVQDAGAIARIIGERAIVTEVTAYQDLAQLMKSGNAVSIRSMVITTYALTGFAHVASLAIFVGGIGALVPERLTDLSRLGLRALLAATLACLMTGAVAGVFFTRGTILIGQ